MFGKFHFVDLAGSERAHRTGNVGDRFKGIYLTEQKIIWINWYSHMKSYGRKWKGMRENFSKRMSLLFYTNMVIISCKSKDRHYNGWKKKNK
jgi:hypothetical protein